jgi:hypothetical protein
MIISHEHRFIFIKTVKTAGTSLETSISRYCGPADIVTPISPEDEAERKTLDVTPRNYLARRREYNLLDQFRLLVRGEPKKRFWNHITAQQVRNRVGAAIWNSYFKFTIERNPWDKTVSDFYWRTRNGGPQTMDEYFRKYQGQFKHYNFPRYSIGGQLAVDCIVRFESFIPDLTFALRQVGITFDGWLPRAKGSTRKDRRHYSEILSSEQSRVIAKHFAPEIELLGYTYEDRRAAA